MPKNKHNKQAQQLHHFLNEVPEQLERKTGFVKRRSKLTGRVFAQTLLLGWLHDAEASVRELSWWSRELGVNISAQGLDKRFNNQAVALLQGLLGEALKQFQQQQPLPAALLKQFKGIYVLDSTYIAVPTHLQAMFRGSGGSGPEATAKIQLSFDYLSGCIAALELGSADVPDQNASLHTQMASPGSLHLFDLGYFKYSVFRDLCNQQAYFISRLNPGCLLYDTAETATALDLPTYLSALAGQRHETTLYLGTHERLPVRVLFEHLPEPVAAERRRKAQVRGKRSQKTRSQPYLSLLSWSIFITNVPASRLDFSQILLLYRVRWQIELIFKLWKSHLKLTRLGSTWRTERVLCHLYARMILLILFQWLLAPHRLITDRELSPDKAFQVLQQFHIPPLLAALCHPTTQLTRWLQHFLSDLTLFAQKTRRRKNPSTYSSILLASPLA